MILAKQLYYPGVVSLLSHVCINTAFYGTIQTSTCVREYEYHSLKFRAYSDENGRKVAANSSEEGEITRKTRTI